MVLCKGLINANRFKLTGVFFLIQEDDIDNIELEAPLQPTPNFQPKLAPWAKVAENTATNGNESSLSLADIQKMEEERERESKMRRELQEAHQARVRQEEEARRQQVRAVFPVLEDASQKRTGKFPVLFWVD